MAIAFRIQFIPLMLSTILRIAVIFLHMIKLSYKQFKFAFSKIAQVVNDQGGI